MEWNCWRVKLTLARIPANTLSVTNMSSRTVPFSLERLIVLIASKRKREKKKEKFYYLGNRVPLISSEPYVIDTKSFIGHYDTCTVHYANGRPFCSSEPVAKPETKGIRKRNHTRISNWIFRGFFTFDGSRMYLTAHDRKLLYAISGAESSGQVEEVSLNNACIYKKVNFNCNYLA